MALQFRNSYSGIKEEFTPIKEGEVHMYTCGPTVYNYQHIGNFRTFTWSDMLKRYLKYKGYKVTHVQNLTDIDDKIIRDSQKTGKTLDEFTKTYTDAFHEDFDALRLQKPDIEPRATRHIDAMVKLVKALVDKGYAYEVDGNYYYKIQSFENYGKLAKLDMAGLKPGARVVADEYEKESVSDFALWKAWDESDGDIYWETELGKGRPGWHLECSVMSMEYLGNHFDIHTGGVDLKFPHHENEVAQSEAATGEKFVNYWLHGEHLIVEGKKMSKSLGNYYTLRDVLDKGYDGLEVRYLLLTTHYRQQLNFTFDGLVAARKSVRRYNDFLTNLRDYRGGESDGSASAAMEKAREGFEAAMDDDLNISGAMGVLFDFIRDVNKAMAEKNLSIEERDQIADLMERFDSVVSLKYSDEEQAIDSEIEELVQKRQEARKAKDFATADQIRDQLAERGIVLEDTPEGVKVKVKR